MSEEKFALSETEKSLIRQLLKDYCRAHQVCPWYFCVAISARKNHTVTNASLKDWIDNIARLRIEGEDITTEEIEESYQGVSLQELLF